MSRRHCKVIRVCVCVYTYDDDSIFLFMTFHNNIQFWILTPHILQQINFADDIAFCLSTTLSLVVVAVVIVVLVIILNAALLFYTSPYFIIMIED